MKYLLPFWVAAMSLGQVQPARLEFEVASVKPTAALSEQGDSYGRKIDGAQVRFIKTSLRDYLRVAYRVRDYQIEAPGWLASTRFDVSGKLPEGRAVDQVPEMLQALLADRFALKVHRATKTLPVYALAVRSDGIKMKESPADPAEAGSSTKPTEINVSGMRGRGAGVDYGGGSYFAMPHYRWEARKVTMALFCDTLGRMTDRAVIDQTGLAGRYNFDLDLAEDDYDAMITRAAASAGVVQSPKDLLHAAEIGDPLPMTLRRLGLHLESRKGPVEVLVVDEMRKTPTEE